MTAARPVRKPRRLPEYMEQQQIDALIQQAPHGRARLVMMMQWRAGLRISEALNVRLADVSLAAENPTLRVRSGKGQRDRIVPIHPELRNEIAAYVQYGTVRKADPLVDADRRTAWRWYKLALARAVTQGDLPIGRRVATHTLRHSYARHLLTHGVPINALSRWLGHSRLDTTLIYLELVGDPTGTLAGVP